MRVYNSQLEYIYRVRDFQAINFTRKYTGTGAARITLAKDDAANYYLQKNHFLVIDEEPYIIKHIEQGLERTLIQAYTCHALLDQRLTGKGSHKTEQIVSVGTADAVVKDFINRSKGDLPITTKPDQADPITVRDITRLKKLGDEVKRVLDLQGRGEKFTIEDNTLYFDTYKGADKTTEVIFSADLGNLDEMVYTETAVDDKTTVYIGGAGEGADREMEVVGDDAAGLDRIEVFSDARDVDEGDTEELINRAEQLLTSTQKAITATLMQGNFELGDLVTVRIVRPSLDGNTKKDETTDLHLRITEMAVARQDGEEHIDLQFGTIPLMDSDPIKELRKKMAQMETAETPIERITEQVKGDIEETLIGEVEDLNEFANALMGLYTTKVTLPDNSEIIYSHDEEQLEDSAFIATKHAGAIAWTTTGWNDGHPAWQYGVDQTGNAIFRLISTVGLNANWINAGKVKAEHIEIGPGTDFTAGYDPSEKRRTFTSTPAPPYDVGDLWTEGSTGDIKRCKTAKAAGGSYSAADWELASKYTDDTTVNTLAGSLGDLAYDDLVELAKLGSTIISGGYIKTELIQIGEDAAFEEGYDPTKTKYANRNYLLKSNITRTRVSGGRYVGNWVPSVPMVAGKTYTMTVKAKLGAGTTGLRIYVSQNYSQLGRIDFSGTDIEVASLTFTCSYYSGRTPQDNIANANVALWIYPDDASNPNDTVVYWVKLEDGDKSTEWVLAPEDDLLADVSYKGVMINKDDGFVSTATIGGKTALVKMNSTDGIVIVHDGDKTFGVDIDGSTFVTKLMNPNDPTAYATIGRTATAGGAIFSLYGTSGYGNPRKKLSIESYLRTAVHMQVPMPEQAGEGDYSGANMFALGNGPGAHLTLWGYVNSVIMRGGDNQAGNSYSTVEAGEFNAEMKFNNRQTSVNHSLGVDNTGPYLAIDNTKTYFADAPQTLTLTANWSHQSYSTYGSFIAQLINPNAVMLNGTIKSSVANDSGAITTLPEKYRPNKRKMIPVSKLGDANVFYILSIATSGVISLYDPTYSANNIVAIHGVVYNINEPL